MILLIARWHINTFLKLFTTKKIKKYQSQIWQHNMQHINLISIKDVIIFKNAEEKQELSKDPADITALAKMAQALSPINLVY